MNPINMKWLLCLLLILAQSSTPVNSQSLASNVSRLLERGLNIGNTFDKAIQPTNPKRLRAMLSAHTKRYYRHVRIPVTWMGSNTNLSESRLYDQKFMAELDDAIFYALQLGLSVIINTHHENWLNDFYTGSPEQDEIVQKLWVAIAKRYNNTSYPRNRLIFEVLNEPHGVFGDWVEGVHPFSDRALQLTRQINNVGWAAIRSVDRLRIISVQPNAMGNIYAVSAVWPTAATLPGAGKDSRILVSVHTYDDWSFCGQDGNDNYYASTVDWKAAMRAGIDDRIGRLAKWHTTIGGDAVVGVSVGEYGVGRRDRTALNSDIQRYYYKYMTYVLRTKYKYAACAWDDSNNGWFMLSEYNAEKNTVSYPFGRASAMFPPYDF